MNNIENLNKLLKSLFAYVLPSIFNIYLWAVIFLVIISLFSCESQKEEAITIDADDAGIGSCISVPVKMTQPIGSIQLYQTQAWNDTGLKLVSNNNDNGVGVTLSVANVWFPLGKGIKRHECELESCSNSDDPRCKVLQDPNTLVVKTYGGNKYCKLSDGKGLYLLFAKPNENGQYNNPNASYASAAYPSPRMGFYTSHLGAFKVKDGSIFVNKAWNCEGITGSCQEEPMTNLLGSRIYIKLVDDLYGDNETINRNNLVKVNFKRGVYKPNLIATVIETIESSIENVSHSLRNSILGDIQKIVSATLILYLLFNAFGFALGMINMSFTEFIVRIFKLALVVMLTNPHDNLTKFFIDSFKVIAEAASGFITVTLPNLQSVGAPNMFVKLAYLLPYENLINQLISYQVHTKILSLCLTTRFYFIPFLYILLLILMIVILKSLLLFIIAYMQLAVLVIVFPIMAIMLLFQLTNELFQNWMRYMANSAMLITVTVLATGLILSMIGSGLEDLLYFQTELDIFWFPVGDQASKALTVDKLLFILLKSLIAYTIIDFIPGLVDAFTNAQFSPSANSFRSMQRGITSWAEGGWDSIRKFNTRYLVGRLLDQAYKENNKYSKDKEGTTFLDKFHTGRKNFQDLKKSSEEFFQNIQRAAHDNSLVSLHDPIAAQKIAREQELMQLNNNLQAYENKLKDKSYNYISHNVHSIEFIQNKQKVIVDAGMLQGEEVMINGYKYKTANIYETIARGNSRVGDSLTISLTKYKDAVDPTRGIIEPSDPAAKEIISLQRKLQSIKSKL